MSSRDPDWPPDFDPPQARKTFIKQVKAPLRSGFSVLSARGTFQSRDRSMAFVVSAPSNPPNRGPGFSRRTSARVPRGSTPRAALDAFLEETVGMLERREIPERGLLLDRCNASGQDVGTFIERVCSGCCCWYCELSC